MKGVARQECGVSLILMGPDVGTVTIEESVAQRRVVLPDSQIVQTARDLGIIFGDRGPEELHCDRKPAKAAKSCKKKAS